MTWKRWEKIIHCLYSNSAANNDCAFLAAFYVPADLHMDISFHLIPHPLNMYLFSPIYS